MTNSGCFHICSPLLARRPHTAAGAHRQHTGTRIAEPHPNQPLEHTNQSRGRSPQRLPVAGSPIAESTHCGQANRHQSLATTHQPESSTLRNFRISDNQTTTNNGRHQPTGQVHQATFGPVATEADWPIAESPHCGQPDRLQSLVSPHQPETSTLRNFRIADNHTTTNNGAHQPTTSATGLILPAVSWCGVTHCGIPALRTSRPLPTMGQPPTTGAQCVAEHECAPTMTSPLR